MELTIHYQVLGLRNEAQVNLLPTGKLHHKKWAGTVATGDNGEAEPCTWHRVEVDGMTILEVPHVQDQGMFLSWKMPDGSQRMCKMPDAFYGNAVTPT